MTAERWTILTYFLFLPPTHLDSSYVQFFGDDFLRTLILRFVFCDVTMRLHPEFSWQTSKATMRTTTASCWTTRTSISSAHCSSAGDTTRRSRTFLGSYRRWLIRRNWNKLDVARQELKGKKERKFLCFSFLFIILFILKRMKRNLKLLSLT